MGLFDFQNGDKVKHVLTGVKGVIEGPGNSGEDDIVYVLFDKKGDWSKAPEREPENISIGIAVPIQASMLLKGW